VPVAGRYSAIVQLLDHVSITVRDLERAKPFYKAVLGALGAVVAYEREDAIGFGERIDAVHCASTGAGIDRAHLGGLYKLLRLAVAFRELESYQRRMRTLAVKERRSP
jgi:catechol 2,3-dioxygenase-like lactoylglutathione lyase family enzyme